MNIKKTDNPDVMEYKETGGCYALLFLITGAFMFLAGLGGLAKPTGDPMTRKLLVLGPSIFAIGTIIMSWRSTIQFDRKNKKIIKTIGLFLPLKVTEEPLDIYKSIVIEKIEKKGPDGSYFMYETSLVSDSGNMMLRSSTKLKNETEFAKKFSEFLSIELTEKI